MKKLSAVFAGVSCMLFLVCFSFSVFATEKPKTELESVIHKGNFIQFTIHSAKPFIMADNRYVLYIGKRSFFRCHQTVKDGTGTIVFYIPEADFQNLQQDAIICLSYGDMFHDREDQIEKVCAEGNPKCWNLGKFSKTLLKN